MPRRILIIGGGASGVLLTVHLLHDAPGDLSVTIIERRAELGAGAAYATNHPDHLLNVRASNMSAFPADPGHFVNWLTQSADGTALRCAEQNSFAPRHLYRDYLAGLLAPHLATGRLVCLRKEVVGVTETSQGVRITLADDSSVEGDIGIVATGNEGPSLPPQPWRFDGWTDGALGGIDPTAVVVVVGTGLTMVDRVLALLHGGHRGPITAVSRRGLMPHSHKPVSPTPTSAAEIPFGSAPSHMTAWLRTRTQAVEEAGGDWRSVIDGLRPHTAALWQALSFEDRKRFIRHAKPYWDQHRHRIAPETAARLATARASGQLQIVAAHVTGFSPHGDGVDVHIAHRGTGAAETLAASAVFECRGRSPDVTRTENPALRHLLASGTARPDPLALGLDVTTGCALIDAAGRASARLFALGPVTAGVLWEIVAIPDIRVQAAKLAADLRAADQMPTPPSGPL